MLYSPVLVSCQNSNPAPDEKWGKVDRNGLRKISINRKGLGNIQGSGEYLLHQQVSVWNVNESVTYIGRYEHLVGFCMLLHE